MFRALSILLCCVLQQAQPADPQADKPKVPPPPPQFNDIMEESKKLGPWEQNAPLEKDAINLFFERNQWTSPEDQFARDLVLKVNQVPPWDQQGRQDIFLNAVTERLSLSADQQRRLSRSMQRESLRMTINHFSEVAPVAMEMVKTRASGQPFTPDQVARWMTVVRPIAEEARESAERVGRELARDMTPAQKAMLEQDMRALIRRHRTVSEQMVKWENGEWRAEDWGLNRDPIQRGERLAASSAPTDDAALAAAKAAAQASLRHKGAGEPGSADQTTPMPAAPVRENEWERYVREYAARHDFTAAQRVSARGILKDLLARAHDWREANRKRIDTIEIRIRSNTDPTQTTKLSAQLDQLNAPLREMFEELKSRLAALLTAEQRGRENR